MSNVKRLEEVRNLQLRAYSYFDRACMWLKDEDKLDEAEARWLRERCGPGPFHPFRRLLDFRPDRGKNPLKVFNTQAPFSWEYTQWLDIKQPSPEALKALAQLDGLVTYVEPARDFILPAQESALLLNDLFDSGFVQPWHGKMEPVGYPEGGSTRKSPDKGERRSGRWFYWYADRTCKLTGEPCFHFEGRHQDARFVRRLGIRCPADLLDFDFDHYFEECIRLYEVDFERLGRFHDNKLNDRRRRSAHISRYGYNFDARLGGTLYHVLSVNPDGRSRSIQSFVDAYGRGPFLKLLKLSSFSMYMEQKASFGITPSPRLRIPSRTTSVRHSRPFPPSSSRTNDTKTDKDQSPTHV